MSDNPGSWQEFSAGGKTKAAVTEDRFLILHASSETAEYRLESIHNVKEIDLLEGRKAVAIQLNYKAERHPALTFDDPTEAGRFCRALREVIDEPAGLGVGMVVAIYDRPLTREGLEAYAELVERAAGPAGGEGLERWVVRFSGEGEEYPRVVRTDEADHSAVMGEKARLWANVYLDMSDRPSTAWALGRQDALEGEAKSRGMEVRTQSEMDHEGLCVEGTLWQAMEIARALAPQGYSYHLDLYSQRAERIAADSSLFSEIELEEEDT